MKITLDSSPNAPGCVRIVAADGRDVLVQVDYDFCGVASTFGWSPALVDVDGNACRHVSTDGTIDCPDCGATAGEFIASAGEWLDEHDGAEVEDPGYFDGE